jgi:hypothetical protein
MRLRMRGARIRVGRVLGASFAVALATLSAAGHPARSVPEEKKAGSDPLAAEIQRWSIYVRTNASKDELWEQVKEAVQPALTGAERALSDGRRLLALQKLAAVWPNVAATVYVAEHPGPESREEAAFEAEWARMGRILQSDLGTTSPRAFDGVRPAAVRAVAEAALPQVRVFYEASLEYGRSTTPDFGLFYLGSARAQREFAAFCRTLSFPAPRRAPPLRSLAGELDALETTLLSAYRPPASIDRHSEFITVSSALKEARELDAAGLRHGALLKYLQAALRAVPLTPTPPKPLDGGALADRLRGFEERLSAGDRDHSIGRIFLESAQADVAVVVPPARPATAETIVADVFPRYFAALEPARPQPKRPAPRVTVTLVRWPYT